jgi:hypothetical protein
MLKNNILYQNRGTIQDLGSGTNQSHNLVTDPKFIDPSANNFHLQPNSPAIDAGITIPEVTTDFDGITRPQGNAYDIGAYEFVGNNQDTTPPTISITHSPTSNITTTTQLTITATATDESGISNIEIFVDDTIKKSCTSSPCAYASTYSAGTNTYYATAKDNSPNKNQGRDPISGTKNFSILTVNSCEWDFYPEQAPDGKVTLGDVLAVLKDFGKKPGDAGYNPKKNFNDDPKIDLGDVLTVLTHFGDCPND